MGFLKEPAPRHGVAEAVLPGVRRIVADNPGPMTFHGTNTYLIGPPEDLSVLDPGPDSPAHVAAILAASGGRVARILLTHTHRDHFGGLAALQAATGAPSHAFHRSADPDFTPDHPLADGESIAGLTALHTPGHAADHLCFAASDGVLFSGDHVMSWSTSIVSPPGGDMAAYCDSLRLLLARTERVYLCGHGPRLDNPLPFVRALLSHRMAREAAILAALADGASDVAALTRRLYAGLAPGLRRAAERNVLAHLLKLQAEARVHHDGALWVRTGAD